MARDPWAAVPRWSALLAGPLVLLLLTWRHLPIPQRLVAFACVTPVPLGLVLAVHRDGHGRHYRLSVALLPLAMVGIVVSFLHPTGSMLAKMGAGAHLLASVAIGAFGVRRILRRGLGPRQEASIDLGLLFLPAGAVWLFASRAGTSLAGFYEPIVLLTAAHFHYAGFGAPIVLGVAGRLLPTPTLPYRVGTLAVCAGVPMTAIGIATTRAVETSSAIVLASGMLLAAWVLVVHVGAASLRRSVAAGVLVMLSGTCLLLTMALAATFALTGSAGRDGSFSMVVSFDRMVLLHGAVNALGFVTAGLVGLSLLDPTPRATTETTAPSPSRDR